MPNVGGKKFPYTKQGMKDAEEAKDKMGYKKGGDVKKKKKKVKASKGKSLKELGMTPSPAPRVPGKLQSSPMNNTSAPKPPTAAQAATPKPPVTQGAPGGMGAMMKPPVTQGAPGGMGAMMKPMGMKKGGKVKKAKSGGKVRGAGIAKKGVKKCKMR